MRNKNIEIIERIIEEFEKKEEEEKVIALNKCLNAYKRMLGYSNEYRKRNREKINAYNLKRYYERKNTIGTYYQNNKEKLQKYAHDYRRKKVERLKNEGIRNAWAVVTQGKKPIYVEKRDK